MRRSELARIPSRPTFGVGCPKRTIGELRLARAPDFAKHGHRGFDRRPDGIRQPGKKLPEGIRGEDRGPLGPLGAYGKDGRIRPEPLEFSGQGMAGGGPDSEGIGMRGQGVLQLAGGIGSPASVA